MRRLSLKQKKLVKEYFDNDLLDYTNVEHRQNKADLIIKLEKLNDYETLWSDVDRLVDDLISNEDLDLKNWG